MFKRQINQEKNDIDSPNRYDIISARIQSKPALVSFYRRAYLQYKNCMSLTPDHGIILEIGSGAGFVKEAIPQAIRSDIIRYPNLDFVLNATRLPFANQTIRMIAMLNVFHHVADVEKFLAEATRCLIVGGRVMIVDPHVGLISSPILTYGHSEPFDPSTSNWDFNSLGPLSSANNALSWIVFQRDLERFKKTFPFLKLVRYEPHTPLLYWLAGGLKNWSLVNKSLLPLVNLIDSLLINMSNKFGSFVDVELLKTAQDN